MSRIRMLALVAVVLCAACRPAPAPDDDKLPDPQAAGLHDTVQAPIEKARAAVDTVQAAADRQREAIEDSP